MGFGTKVRRLCTKNKRTSLEIEEVQEAFCGSRKKDMVPLCDADPTVAAEWFYEKNCGWGPEDFSHGSSVKAWWECQYCLRVYKAPISRRVCNKSGCPYCASKRVCSDNALVVLYPEVAKEWHPSKNGKLKVSDIIKFSIKEAWWLCSKCGHEWKNHIADRTFQGAGCPACYRARIEIQKANYVKPERDPIVIGETEVPRVWYENTNKKYKTLTQSHPKIAKEWHPERNGNWTPNDFASASGVTAWWLCKKGPDHEWQATICHRTKSKRGCPFCAGKKVSKTSSLKHLFPKLAKEWHATKNGKLKPDAVTTGTERKVWWQCKRYPDHEWEASVYGRAKSGRGCPFCSHTKVSAQNSLKSQFPYIAVQMHPTKNGELTGDHISAQSGKKIWWICPKGPDHEWKATPSDRTFNGSGCPACVGKQISITNCLQTVKPEAAKLWDKKKNGSLTAKDVTVSSKLVVFWRCKKGHSWQQSICQRAKAVVECWQCLGRKPPGYPAKVTKLKP